MQTLQGMVGRTNFPSTILFPLLLLDLGNLWNCNQIKSWFSQFITTAENVTNTVRFLICSSSEVFNTRFCKEGRSIKYKTTNGPYSFYNLVKEQWARLFCLAGWIRPTGRRLPTPGLYSKLVVPNLFRFTAPFRREL